MCKGLSNKNISGRDSLFNQISSHETVVIQEFDEQ